MRHFTAAQICKALKDHGWFFDRQTGSHAQYKHPNFGIVASLGMMSCNFGIAAAGMHHLVGLAPRASRKDMALRWH